MDQRQIEELIDPAAIARAEPLGLVARYIVEGYMAGEHKSPYRGFAIEFAQHREYSFGDDLRHLDWKVLGRTDRYFIKQYEQETNYVANILLDGSESMQYGSGKLTKFQYGKVLAACLSYLILQQRDAVALGIFDETMKDYAPRSDNRATLPALLTRLASFKPSDLTNIGEVLDSLAQKIRRKGIVILITDLFDDEARLLEGIQHLRFGGSEVILFHVMDPHEIDFPFNGLVEFEGLERVPKILTRPGEIRNSYLKEVQSFCARVREGCEKNQVHYVMANTGRSVADLLGGYLAFRQRTLKRK
ncbi:MAG: DUF58 domain-containing protein [Pedosphaera sp.]|nr:DUF58 domain-containing protein [Pedosphaera sp.]